MDRQPDPQLGATIVETMTQPLLAVDDRLVVEFVNPAFLRHFKVTAEETVGHPLTELGNGQWAIPELIRLLEQVRGQGGRVEDYRVAHRFERIGRRVLRVTASRIQREGQAHTVLLALTDVTAQEDLAAEVEGRAEFGEKLIDSIREALLVLRRDLTVHSANQAFYDHFRVRETDLIGRPIYALGHGEWDNAELRALLEEVLPRDATFDDYLVETDFPGLGRRVMLLNGRRLDHLNLILLAIRDVTEKRESERQQAERERRQAFLLQLGDALRDTADPQTAIERSIGLLGRFLGAGQVVYAEIDPTGEHGTVPTEWTDGSLPSNARTHRLNDYGPDFVADLTRGRTVVVTDVSTDPRTAAPAALATYDEVGVRAFVNVPLVKDGTLRAVLGIHQDAPRTWTAAEVALAEEVADRTWAAAERARSERSLAEANALLDAIFEAAPIGLGLWDRNFRFLKINAHLAEINGLPPQAHIGKRPDELLPDVDLAETIDRAQRVAETGEPVHGVEICGTTPADPDRERVWIASFFPVRLGGELGAIGATVEEITQQRQREEQVRILMREVTHRSKNLLGLVQAIARQTNATAGDHFIERFSERIRALSAGLDILVRNEWRGADLASLVRAQLAHFADALEERVTLSGPPVIVTASAAQTLGMALHELATNAGKYGALSNTTGRVAIAWWLESDGAVERFVLSWSESGGPPVTPPERSGFGSFVTATLVERTLGAEVAQEYAPVGLAWRMRCPAQGIVEAVGPQGEPAHPEPPHTPLAHPDAGGA